MLPKAEMNLERRVWQRIPKLLPLYSEMAYMATSWSRPLDKAW
jgi:hypothetical protein